MDTHITIPMARLIELETAEHERDILRTNMKVAHHGMPDEGAGLSWDGFNVRGDAQSVREVRRLVEFHAARSTERPNAGGEARLAAHQPSQTTTATPQGVASTDQLGGRVRSEKDDE